MPKLWAQVRSGSRSGERFGGLRRHTTLFTLPLFFLAQVDMNVAIP